MANSSQRSSTAMTPTSQAPDDGPDVLLDSGSAPSLPSVDSENDLISDSDSALGRMNLQTSTASLRSSIFEHVEENGRTYHRYRQGKYPLPNDELEQERLDLQHAVFNAALSGKLYLAPLKGNPQHVLDIATGTGIWAIDFAQMHPSARVVGTDLSPIQPLYIPPNVQFEIDDAEDEWIFSQQFDFIHGRALVTCFKDPSFVIAEAYKSLAPGGYLELQDGVFPFEYIGEPPTDSAIHRWNELVVAGAAKTGRPWTNVQYYKHWMEETGLENVVEKTYYVPTNPWAKGKYFKDIAMLWHEDMTSGLEGISLKLLGNLGWSVDEIHVFLAAVRDDFKNPNIHCYTPMKVVHGRKPEGVSF